MDGYCLKCKKKRTMNKAKLHVMKNKRRAAKGTCIKCETKMFKILKEGEKVNGK